MHTTTHKAEHSKYFLPASIFFVAILMISNTVAVKMTQVGPFIFDAATWLFPISYIFGDVFTEVYGYRATRKVVWYAIMAQILMACTYILVQYLPAPGFWADQAAYESILGVAPRIVCASLVAFFAGELSNAYTLSKMKIYSKGKHLWQRTIGSTIIGEGVDTVLFIVLAFGGVFENSVIVTMIISNYLFKVAYETLATPLTYAAVSALKKSEGVDVYDTNESYNPFTLA
jgi:queuosine precursor transporter